MKKHIIILAIILLVTVQSQLVRAQSAELMVGDQVPDVPLKIVETDGTVKNARLSDYFDRLLILDFMYSNCSSCIKGLPKMDYLQRKFGDQVEIMVVIGGAEYVPDILEKEDEAYVKDFLANNSYLLDRQVQIPWVVGNETLNQLFPHVFVSHLVWIHKGRVVAITEKDYVNSDNIQFILEGEPNDWPVKNDFLPPMDVHTPLVRQDSGRFTGNPPMHKYAAVFGSYQEGIFSKHGLDYDSTRHMLRTYFINLPVLNIYIINWNKIRTASGKQPLFPAPSHIILEVKDLSKYVKVNGDTGYEYRQKAYISYESVTGDTGQTEAKKALAVVRDLDHLLCLHGRFEKRNVKCLSLVSVGDIDKLRSKGEREMFIIDDHLEVKKIQNKPLSTLVYHLNQYYENPPVFDATSIDYPVDINLEFGSWTNIPSIRRALLKYGLDFKEEERELEVFVLTEKCEKQ